MTQPPLLHPPALSPGARVAIVSPAGPVLPEHLEAGLELLADMGLEPVLPSHVWGRHHALGYLAGEDTQRLEALRWAMHAPDVDAVICSRGGYGAMRLLPSLDPARLRARPRLLVGFSDITALHLWMSARARVASLHGPVLKSVRLHPSAGQDPNDSRGHLRRALLGQRGGFTVEGLQTVRPGRIEGPVYGGNLSLVAAVLATPYCPDLRGAILVLEDITEPDYRLDRLMTTLRLSERAQGLGGIVLGEFLECGGVYLDEEAIEEHIARLAAEFGCPVVAGFPTGHGARNVAVPMGVPAALDADAGRITFSTDAVASP